MKTALYLIIVASLLTLGSVCLLTSCEKDNTIPPELLFKTAQGYTSSNTVVAKKTEVKIGVSAAKTNDKDFLTKFTISRSRNNGASATVFSKNLTGVDRDQFSYDFITTTDDISSVDNYTFAVESDEGLSNKVSLTLEVQ